MIGLKIVRSQPSSQHTFGACRLQPPISQKELVWYCGTWCRRGRTRTTTVGSSSPPPKAMPQIDTQPIMAGKQKERPVATRQIQTRIRPPTPTASFVYQTPIPVCFPASNNGICGILLINNVFNQRYLLPSLHHPRTLRRCRFPVAPRRSRLPP